MFDEVDQESRPRLTSLTGLIIIIIMPPPAPPCTVSIMTPMVSCTERTHTRWSAAR